MHFVRDKVLEKKSEVRYVPSHEQIVDSLKKGLPPPRFKYLICKLNVTRSPYHLRGGVKEGEMDGTAGVDREQGSIE